MAKKPIKRYSQAFKQQVVQEYESGSSIYRLRKKYGIGGHKTVERWIEQYSREGIRHELMRIQTVEDQVEVQTMHSRISELESALAEQVLENRMLRATLAAAEQEYGVDTKKNSGNESSSR